MTAATSGTRAERDVADRRSAHRAIGVSAVGLLLTGTIELALAVFTGSVGLLGDALHNLSDVSTSAVVFLGFRISKKQPSQRYPYGYERAEDLVGLLIALVIWGSAVLAGYESYRKLVDHGATSSVYVGMTGAVLGIVGNQLVARYKLRVGRQIHSATLVADAKHSWLDALSSAGALGGLILVALGYRWGDPLAGFAVTLFICHVGFEVTREVTHHLMDGVDADELDAVRGAVADVAELRVVGVRGRWLGRSLLVEVQVEVSDLVTFAEFAWLRAAATHRVMQNLPAVREVSFVPVALDR